MKSVKRLYTEFQPERYELFLEPDRDAMSFSGQVKIIGKKTGRPSQRLTLHQNGLKISSAKLTKIDKKAGQIPIEVVRTNTHKTFDELRLHTAEQLFPGEYIVEIKFSGKITEPMHGIYPCNFNLDGQAKQLIATQFESHHAREAFPCIDEPEAKAVFSLSLKTPAGEIVIANTPIQDQKTQGKKITTRFEDTPRMSSYLLAFAYGELGFKESKTKSGIGVRVYATPDKVELTNFALDAAVHSLEFFEDYYGVAYPLPKMDVIGLPDFSAGAMENWGLITFRESVLYVDPKSTSIETKQVVAMVIGHEMAHQWFGNLVTMKWWNDLWLNESFAELMGYRFVDHYRPEWNIWQVFMQREVSSALSRDALPNVQPVQVEVNHPDELGSVFDPSIVYAKGAALINTVRHMIGEDVFCQGLKSYFEEHKYSNTVADDLWIHLKKVSQTDIQAIMKNWLQRPGYPVIEAEYNAAQHELTLAQERLVIGKGDHASKTTWQVPLAASSELNRPLLTQRQATIKVVARKDYPLTLNHNGHSYFISQYLNEKHFEQIKAAVEKGVLSAIDRLLLVQNHLLLERAGRVSTLQNIQMLPAYANEREEAVWGMLIGILGNTRTLIDKDEQLEVKLNAFVRPITSPLVKELGWQGSIEDTAQTQKLRALILSLAAVAEDKEVIKHGLGLFKDFKQPADLSPDIRAVVYFIAVRYGESKDFTHLIDQYRKLTNSDEKEEIAAELVATRDEQKIDSLLAMMKTDVRPQDLTHWFAWLIRNRYSSAKTWQWLTDNWDWIDEKFGSDKSYDYFPRYAASAFSLPAQLEAYKHFFEPRSNIALERAIKLGVEEIEGRIAWRKKNEPIVKDWLINQAQ